MAEQVALALFILIVALPIVLVFRENKGGYAKNMGLASLYHVVYVIFIFVPIAYPFYSIANGTMNWTGKLLALLFSTVFYFAMRKHFEAHDYVLSFPTKGSLKKTILVGSLMAMAMSALTLVFSGSKDLNVEVLVYQITMPGLDEELWRGIVLGLLVSITKGGKFKFGHPAIWASTLIFALGHSLYLENWEFGLAADAFVVTGILGYLLGWMTYHGKSILPALIFHNLVNFSTHALEMFLL